MTSPRRAFAALALGAAMTSSLATSLAACGGDDGTTATDTSPTSSTTSATPTATPTVGTYPAFPHADYAYTLGQQCFCAHVDQRYRITVTGGAVESVTWATKGDGHQVGDPMEEDYLRITIQDIIDQANDTEAAHVEVDWPAGQEYPDRVYVDQDAQTADEEVTWLISDVETA